MHPQLMYSEEFIVRTFHIDRNKRLRLPHLINLMQEAAMQNVIQLGVSVWDLEAHNVSWVLMRMHLQLKRIPLLGEQIRIITRPAGFEKYFTYRDYWVFDGAGQLIAQAPSTWLLMDTSNRKMKRIPQFILEYKMPPNEDCLDRIRHKLPPFGTAESCHEFEVHWHDLDFNRHLSNMLFVKWMLDSIDPEFLDTKTLESFDIFYRAECRIGDKIVASVQQTETHTFLHRLSRKSDGNEVASAQSQWK